MKIFRLFLWLEQDFFLRNLTINFPKSSSIWFETNCNTWEKNVWSSVATVFIVVIIRYII